MATDFLRILQEVRGTGLPGAIPVDGIYWDVTLKDYNGNPGMYGDILAMYSDVEPMFPAIRLINANLIPITAVADNIEAVTAVDAIELDITTLAAIDHQLTSLYMDKAVLDSLFGDKGTLDSLYSDKLALDSIFADKIILDSLYADKLTLDSLYADKATLDSIFADKTTLDSLYADKSKLDSLFSDKLVLDSLYTDKATLDGLYVSKTAIDSLYTIQNKLESLHLDKATLDSLYADKITLDRLHTSIANIDRTATSADNIDTVVTDLTNVDTVAGSITSVNSVGTNINAVIDAEANAATSVASMDLAAEWAENPENDPVSGTESGYSSKHYSIKSADSAALAEADRVATAADRVVTNADVVLTNADAASTAQDSLDTNADLLATNANAASTAQDSIDTNADKLATQTAQGLAETAQAAAEAAEASVVNIFDTFDDRFLGTKTVDPTLDNDGQALLVGAVYYNSVSLETKFYNGSIWESPDTAAATSAQAASDSAAAALASEGLADADAIATAADRVQTGLDRTQTIADAAATAADLLATNQDTLDTAADRVQTGLDRASATASELAAETAQGIAETARDEAVTSADFVDDLFLGAKTADPLTDNDGGVLQTGAMYYNTTLVPAQIKIWDGTVWNNAIFDTSGVVLSFNTREGPITLTAADVNTALGFTAVELLWANINHPTTIAGYGITDGVQEGDTVALTGDVTGTTTFDTSGNISMVTTVGDNSHTHDDSTITGTETATAFTVAQRDLSADLRVRTIKSSLASESTPAAGADIAFRNDETTDNFLRYTDRAGLVSYLNGASTLDADTLGTLPATSFLRSNADDDLTSAIVVPTDNRDEGMFGTFDALKTQHIWSMGTAYRNAADGTTFGNLYGLAYANNGSAGGHGIYCVQDGVATAGLGTNIWTSGNVIAYSDRRVKTNIAPIGDAMSKILQLGGYTFDRLDTPDVPRQTGVIAQEVQAVLPEAISVGEDGMLAVAYGNLVGLLIEGMKEQQVTLNYLEARVNELEN